MRRPTTNETNIIRNIFTQSMNEHFLTEAPGGKGGGRERGKEGRGKEGEEAAPGRPDVSTPAGRQARDAQLKAAREEAKKAEEAQAEAQAEAARAQEEARIKAAEAAKPPISVGPAAVPGAPSEQARTVSTGERFTDPSGVKLDVVRDSIGQVVGTQPVPKGRFKLEKDKGLNLVDPSLRNQILKIGGGLAAATIGAGHVVAPFLYGDEEKKEEAPRDRRFAPSDLSMPLKLTGADYKQTPETVKPQAPAPTPAAVSDSAKTSGRKPIYPGAMSDILAQIMDITSKSYPASGLPTYSKDMGIEEPKETPVSALPTETPAPLRRQQRPQPQPQPQATPQPRTVAGEKVVTDENLARIVPGSQSWGQLTPEEQSRAKQMYVQGKGPSISVRYDEKTGQFKDITGRDYQDIVNALNAVKTVKVSRPASPEQAVRDVVSGSTEMPAETQAALDAAARARGEMPPSAARQGWTPETWAAAERQSAELRDRLKATAQPTATTQTATEKPWEQMTPQERFQRGEQIRAERDVPEMEAKATAVTTGKPGSRERQAAMDRYRAQQSGTMLPVPKKPLTPTIKTTAADTALGPRVSPEEIALRPERQAKLRAEMKARKAEQDKDREERRTILRNLQQQKWEQNQKQRLGLSENYYNILSERLKNLQEAKQEQRAEARAKSMGFNLPMGHPRSRGGVNVAAIKPERLGPHLKSIVSAGGGERPYSNEAEESAPKETKETPKQPSWGERLKPHIITLMGAAETHKIELSKEEAVSNSADRKRLLAQYKPGSDIHKAAQAVDEIMKTVRRD